MWCKRVYKSSIRRSIARYNSEWSKSCSSYYQRGLSEGWKYIKSSTLIVDEYLQRVSSIQQYILGAPFYQYFSALADNKSGSLQPLILTYFPKEPLLSLFLIVIHSYIIPKESHICVVFSINEEDDTDRSLMQVFLLELSEAKRVIPGGPSVNYSKDEPSEIRGIAKGEKAGVGYLVFCIIIVYICFMM